MTMENKPFEDVSPNKNYIGDFRSCHVSLGFRGFIYRLRFRREKGDRCFDQPVRRLAFTNISTRTLPWNFLNNGPGDGRKG